MCGTHSLETFSNHWKRLRHILSCHPPSPSPSSPFFTERNDEQLISVLFYMCTTHEDFFDTVFPPMITLNFRKNTGNLLINLCSFGVHCSLFVQIYFFNGGASKRVHCWGRNCLFPHLSPFYACLYHLPPNYATTCIYVCFSALYFQSCVEKVIMAMKYANALSHFMIHFTTSGWGLDVWN